MDDIEFVYGGVIITLARTVTSRECFCSFNIHITGFLTIYDVRIVKYGFDHLVEMDGDNAALSNDFCRTIIREATK